LLILCTLLLTACGGSPGKQIAVPTRSVPRTCVVLSVGGAKGIAHLGALAAMKQLGIPISCVVGNSMGALVGSLYATAPSQDPVLRYRGLMVNYVASTKSDAGDRGFLGGLLAGGLILLSGGAALPVLAAGGGGYMLGADSVDKVNLYRFQMVLDSYYGGALVESLSVPFATMHQRIAAEGGGMVDVRNGNVAAAVGASIANPLIFPKFDAKTAGVLDPGVDRVAAIPADDACRMFPGSRLIAVNVSGEPIFLSNRMNCPVTEIVVPDLQLDQERVLMGVDPEFSLAVNAGYRATMDTLTRAVPTSSANATPVR